MFCLMLTLVTPSRHLADSPGPETSALRREMSFTCHESAAEHYRAARRDVLSKTSGVKALALHRFTHHARASQHLPLSIRWQTPPCQYSQANPLAPCPFSWASWDSPGQCNEAEGLSG